VQGRFGWLQSNEARGGEERHAMKIFRTHDDDDNNKQQATSNNKNLLMDGGTTVLFLG
jgi:hypothetical protein